MVSPFDGPVHDPSTFTEEKCITLLLRLRNDGVSRSDAVKEVTDMAGGTIKKSAVYQLALGVAWNNEHLVNTSK